MLQFLRVAFASHAGFTVACGDEEMVVYLKRTNDLINKKVTLLDVRCTLDIERNSNMTHVWLKTPLKSCSTETSTDGDTIIYQNSVVITSKTLAREIQIRRDVTVEMPFRCSKRGNNYCSLLTNVGGC